MLRRCVVVGGGPAGLSRAFWMLREDPEAEVLVLEAAAQAGGWVQSMDLDGMHCELGPQAIRPDAASEAMVAALGLKAEVLPANPEAKQRFVARGGRLHPVPAGPSGLLGTKLFSMAGKLRLFAEPFCKAGRDPEESMAAFLGRRLGAQTVPLAESLASGVFAGDAHRLEMASAFATIWQGEQDHGSLFASLRRRPRPPADRPRLHSFGGGMQQLVDALRDHLDEQPGGQMRYDSKVLGLRQTAAGYLLQLADGSEISAEHCCLAVPATAAAQLLAEVDDQLAQELGMIQRAGVVNVYMAFPRDEVAADLQGFGFLVDRREATPVLGVIYTSSIFPSLGRSELFVCRAMLGGALQPEVMDWDDAALRSEAEARLRQYIGLRAPLLRSEVRRAPAAIPQYEPGHRARVERIRARLEHIPRLQLCGNSYTEVSVVGQLRRHTGALPAWPGSPPAG